MRKILLMLAALIMGTGLATVAATGSASAATGVDRANCISPTEKNNLRPGMSPGDVRRATHANPWLRTGDTVDGQRISVEAFNDCRPNSGKVVGVAYKQNYYTGGRTLIMVGYIAL